MMFSKLKQHYLSKRFSRLRLNLIALIMFGVGVGFGMFYLANEVILPRILALTESSKTMPTDVAFNRSTSGGLAGYSDSNGQVAVLSSEVRIATSSAWWDANYLYKKQITLKNLSSQDLTASASAQVAVNTKELYDAGKLKANCEDLRVAFIATQSANVRQELPRSVTLASGATNCSDSESTIVTFPRKETLWAGGQDSNYELYYGNSNAADPGYGDNGFDIIRADGSTVSATLVCPFNGTTTCVDGETPTTETGAIRYSGGKGALEFDGKDDYVSITGTNFTSGDLTIEGWVKITRNFTPSGYWWGYFINKGNAEGGDGFYIRFWNDGRMQFLIGDGGSSFKSLSSSVGSFSVGTWQYLTVVVDSTNKIIRLFINGDQVNQVNYTGNLGLGSTSDIYLAAQSSGNLHLAMEVDELRISDTARYTSNFTPPTAPFEPDENTVLLYHFDENGDDPRNSGKVIDASGNGNDGTIYGAKYVSGLVGVDSSSTDTGKVSIQPYAGHQGIFIEEGTTNLITNPSFENSTAYNTNWTLPYFNYSSSSDTFTAAMAKRNVSGAPFAGGVMVEGEDSTITDDVLSFSRGTLINGQFYSNLDTNQGSVVFWITPEWSGNDNKRHYLISDNTVSGRFIIYKESDNKLYLTLWGLGPGYLSTDISGWVAGTTYNVIVRWDKNTLDGSNYASISVNDAHTFGLTTGSPNVPSSTTIYIGKAPNDNQYPANALIEGLTIYRRPLFDGQYGIDVGNGDEIAQIYNNGSGKDPTLITGSWDVVFALPTNASTGQLTSGTGEAWSHPHSSNLLYTNTTNTGGFMMNGDYTADGWTAEANGGTTPTISALATSEKIFAGGYKVTSDAANEGIYYETTGVSSGDDFVLRALGHSDGTCSPRVLITEDDGTTEISHLDGTTTSTRTAPDVYIFTWEANDADGNADADFRVKLINTATSGTCYWHQVEVLRNYVNNPSFESGSGNPWTPTGWIIGTSLTNESTQETANPLTGNSSFKIRFNAGTTGYLFGGYVYTLSGSVSSGKFFVTGIAHKSITYGGWRHDGYGANAHLQYQSQRTSWDIGGTDSSKGFVVRKYSTGPIGVRSFTCYGTTISNGLCEIVIDDAFAYVLDDVSLTVTPASETNSTESTGLRVDGLDTLTQTISGLSASSGTVKFKFTPRHSFADAAKFGFANPVIITLYGDASNYLKLYYQDSSTLRLTGVFNGTTVNADYTTPTLDAGTTYNIEISYISGSNLVLKIDGAQKASASGVVDFGTTPTTAYFGSDENGSNQYDGTISNFTSLTPTGNTTAPYYKFGSRSAKLVNGGTIGDEYTISIDPNSTSTHTLSAYVYDGTSGNVGGTVDSSIAKLVFGGQVVTPDSYTDMGGGWWRLTYSAATIDLSLPYGVWVEGGKTVYVDGVQLEAKSYATTYADGSLGTGYSWTGTAHNSTSSRTAVGGLNYSGENINETSGTISFWWRPNWDADENTSRGISFSSAAQNMIAIQKLSGGSNDQIKLIFDGNTILVGSATSKGFALNKWNHMVITWQDGGNIEWYLNNTSLGTTSYTHSGSDFANFVLSTIYGNYADGVISDARLFDDDLTATEVADLYYQGLATHSSGTESDDRYESGTYTYISPVIDLSANGAWGTTPISFTQYLGGGTITYYTRTSQDNSTWSDWAQVTGNSIASPAYRYFQWKADLTPNSGLNDSPVISGMTVSYVQDTTAPQNPTTTALGFSTSSVSSADLTSGNWYNYATPKFTWEAGEDVAAQGQSASGIDKYYVLLTTDSSAVPADNTGDDCFLQTDASTRQFIVGSSPSTCSLTDGTYYLRLQTKDNSGNTADPVTLFTYKYDGTAPDAPASVASTDVGYKAENSFSFFWPAVSDNGPSGIAGYEYKTGTSSGTLSNWQFTTNTTVSGIQAYTEGQNYFYVRAKDNAGNYSTVTTNSGTATFYYNSSAPTAPTNLSISPSTTADNPATENSFTVTWDEPESYSGNIAKYYYCVNCTPSESTMTETTSSETVNRTLSNVALATQQGKNTFYIVAEDNNINESTGHGNRNFDAYASIDFYATTTAPSAPSNLTISDASDRDNSKWRLTLAWEAPTSGSTPDHYEVHRSTDNSSFTKIGEVNGTAYTDGSLTQSKTYYYKVYAVDNAGAKSIASNTVSKAPEGKYNTPPSAGGTPSATVGSTTATISWTTSRKAFGTVEYGKTTSYGSAASETTSTKDHKIKLTGLAPGTTYNYRVLSLDDSELVGYDRSSAYSGNYTFTTLNTPAISDIQVTDISLDSVVVSWKTASLATSEIEYGTTTEYGTNLSVSTTADESTHSVRLTNLKHSTKYHFRVRGVTADGDDIFSEDNTFSTLTYPKVTAYVVKSNQTLNGGSQVIVAWNTNVKTTSVVDYQKGTIDSSYQGDTSPERLTSLNQAQLAQIPINLEPDIKQQAKDELTTTHTITLNQLDDASVYVITIKGRDEYGNQVISDPVRYVTGFDTTPPRITNLNIDTRANGNGSTATAKIIISFNTSEPAQVKVAYDQGSASGEYSRSTPLSQNYTTDHTIVIPDLNLETVYHLKIIAIDQRKNQGQSGDLIAVTSPAQTSALDIILNNLEDVFGFLR